jgi:hypothetical protein
MIILIIGTHLQCRVGPWYGQPGEGETQELQHFAVSTLIMTTAACSEAVQLVVQHGRIRYQQRGHENVMESNALVEPLAMVSFS